MAREDLVSKVLDAVRKCVQLQPGVELTEATNLADNLAVDSLDLFDLGNEIEKTLGIRLTASEGDSLGRMTVGGIVDFLATKLPADT